MSLHKLGSAVLWITGALASVFSTASLAITVIEFEAQARPALSPANAAWVAAQSKSVRSARTFNLNALMTSARTTVKGNPALTEQSASALVVLVLADLERAQAADANAIKTRIDKANRTREVLRDLGSALAEDATTAELRRRIGDMARDLDELNQEMALELQAAMQRIAETTQQRSTLFAKISGGIQAIITNIRG